MKPTIVKTRIDTSSNFLTSGLERELCLIENVELIQVAGNPNQQRIDIIGRAGFQNDTVYELKLLRHNGQVGYQMMRINPDLQILMAHYEGVEKPEDMKSRHVYLFLKINEIRGIEPYR